jgi:hypothetical protein
MFERLQRLGQYFLSVHRLDGKTMDTVESSALTAMGVQEFQPQGPGALHVITNFPYPCDNERGFLTGLLQGIEPTATVTHVPGPCRKEGAVKCGYAVRWREPSPSVGKQAAVRGDERA